MVGGFIYPFSEFATPQGPACQARRLPGRPVRRGAGGEGADGGGRAGRGIRGLDFVVRDVASFKLWAQAIQAMLQQTLNIECKLRTVVESVWFDDVNNGNYDLAIGAVVSTLLDPSDYFNAWYKTGGPQNYSNWYGPAHGRADAADRPRGGQREAPRPDPPGRGDHGGEPAVAAGGLGDRSSTATGNYVKGHNPKDYFGIYDVVRMDTMWLDK